MPPYRYSALALQFTCVVDGKTLIGLKHRAQHPAGAHVDRLDRGAAPELDSLVKRLQVSLADLKRK